MDITQIQETIAQIDQIRQKINAFIKAALAAGTGADAISLMAAIAKDVATSGTDPAAILATINDLTQINNDLDTAVAAVKAQETPA